MAIGRIINRRYKVFRKTLTITDAKKNLGRWLAAAAQGEDIVIICGVSISRTTIKTFGLTAGPRPRLRGGSLLFDSGIDKILELETYRMEALK